MQRMLPFVRAAALVFATACLAACGTHAMPPQTATDGAGGSHATLQLFARHHTPPRPPANPRTITSSDITSAAAAGWQRIAAAAPFGGNGAGTPLLLTDGRVLIGDNASNWYTLTPDASGSYVNGTWNKTGALPPGYGPLYFASAVLADGKVIVNGGEYNFGQQAETNLGAIYDPIRNSWNMVPPPVGWPNIGDAQSAVLPNGAYMIGNCCTNAQAIYNEGTNSWTTTGSGKNDENSEEGWTLLPSGELLTADVTAAPQSELYSPSTGAWSLSDNLPAPVVQAGEIGPQTLRPDGTVLVEGANGFTALYHTSTRTWTAGPNLPVENGVQQDAADAPSAVLPNGHVLLATSPGVYQSPASFFVFDGTSFKAIGRVPNAKNDSSYNLRFLVLPTGQVLETDMSNDVEIYTPYEPPNAAIAPMISSVASTLVRGSTYRIDGVRFNGLTQANMYGDDAQSASNYPLVEIVNDATLHVFFARTHHHSSMSVASQASVFTHFTVATNTETGSAHLYVVTNGIKSAPVSVTVL